MVSIRRYLSAVLLAVLFFIPASSSAMFSGDYFVREVIDGDTITLDNGEIVRYVGLDTPEINEPFYLEAKVRNVMLVQGRVVSVVVCGAEPRDKYGRVLAWVTSAGESVNATLIKEGLARVLTIPPCGLAKAQEYKALENEARLRKLGIWGAAAQKRVARDISVFEAHRYVGQNVRLRGIVRSIMPWGRTWFLEFRSPNGFRAVIMPKAMDEFEMRGINILDYRDKEVEITGVVVERGGVPEILVDSPSRIE
ncbi:SPbeta prophage-derived endonuclease YokF [Anaerolineae bacterium]|nr:SPbeta prophage-derived endonuclease YokF [Anaerolineae bacterium]